MRLDSGASIPVADAWIRRLGMQPHPEGGYYREVYRAAEEIPAAGLPGRFADSRAISTSIYFMLAGDDVSRFHRLRSDELWHHYRGVGVRLHIITAQGTYRQVLLGVDDDPAACLQVAIEHGSWFGAELVDSQGYALVGCTVAPGFSCEDFELAERDELGDLCPAQWALIERLT